MLDSLDQTIPDTLFYNPDDVAKQEVVYGLGCSQRAGECAIRLGTHALVVTDSGIMTAGHPQKILKSLQSAGIQTHLFDGVMENPTDTSIQECAAKFKSQKIDLIVGVGGGSSLDTAKGVNFLLTNGGSMKDYWGVGKATIPLLPMIAIPTTGGTGSECQSYALISNDSNHRKMACGDPSALPKITLLDPELTCSQPFSVCAATGMDALAHALESAVCTRRNASSHRHAKKSFCLLAQNLERVWSDPGNLEARGNVLLGAAHAGAAIERSMLGAAHALANPLTAKKAVIHGQAVSLVMPAVMSYNRQDSTSLHIYSEMAKVAGIAESGSSDNDAFDQLLSAVIRLRKIAGLPELLEAIGCQDLDLEELAQDASEQWTASFNPRKVDTPELLRIYHSIKDYANR
jgi:alcohol dehydrogenase